MTRMDYDRDRRRRRAERGRRNWALEQLDKDIRIKRLQEELHEAHRDLLRGDRLRADREIRKLRDAERSVAVPASVFASADIADLPEDERACELGVGYRAKQHIQAVLGRLSRHQR